MPAPEKKAEKAETKSEAPGPEAHSPPPVSPPKSKEKAKETSTSAPTEKPAPAKPSLPKLRPREWFDHILPNKKGEGFMGYFTREIPEVKLKED